jgi:hypothetical protein
MLEIALFANIFSVNFLLGTMTKLNAGSLIPKLLSEAA